MAQFVLVNVVVAVLMKHLEESHKQVTQPHSMYLLLIKKGAQFCFSKFQFLPNPPPPLLSSPDPFADSYTQTQIVFLYFKWKPFFVLF